MAGEEIIEPFGVPEFFVDGFAEHELHGHNISCLGFRNTKTGRIAVVRLTFPASATQAAIEQAKAALLNSERPIGLLASVVSKVPN